MIRRHSRRYKEFDKSNENKRRHSAIYQFLNMHTHTYRLTMISFHVSLEGGLNYTRFIILPLDRSVLGLLHASRASEGSD